MKSDRFVIFGLGLFLVLLNTTTLCAADDAYHAALRTQLQARGVTGGTWVFAASGSDASESSTLGLISVTNIVVDFKTASGPEPFTQIRGLTTSAATTNPWDAAVRFNTRQPVTAGDSLLLVVWVRGVSASQGTGYLTHILEQTASPYDKSLSLDQTPATEWQQWMIPFRAGLTLPTGQARYQINLG
ncbi:MAG: hypothetical protein EHM18_17000, partial [Acidobacteria bacterium]